MANDVQVNLAFTADTSRAIQAVRELQISLSNLTQNASGIQTFGLDKEINQSINKINELKTVLNSAINVKTGKLDLSALNKGLEQSGTSIGQYAEHLASLGPAGRTAFDQLANAINSAEIPLKRSNSLLQDFALTLKNTVKWQISSSLVHGFVGSMQQAVGYAKDLDRSLNDIRMVSGASVDEMAKFAQEANNAAKKLSTTTTDYTKAALIYYQQGLNDNEVKERTDITIKMANAAGESAQTISDQLTAVWNNFYDGSQSLEHYADAMVKLGADTASSSDEIAEGLEKFAAIGNTVGLGFDEAAAALATVTATTRQSADIVGTAFKTLFARIQDLELGDTLEDGTTLGKYSEALNVVGINIKDSNGELKDMNDIILEMGNKWNTISKDQQVALAQTVAGVRQYTQLIALMENFDFYKENLARAQGADGTLQKQADIYAESWQAASKRVKASLEDIYDSIIDDKFFIDLTNGFAKFLDLIADVTDGIGGLRGVFLLLTTAALKLFSGDIAQGMNNFVYNLQGMTEAGRKKRLNEAIEQKRAVNQASLNLLNNGTVSESAAYDVTNEIASLQDQLLVKSEEMISAGREMNEVDKIRISSLVDQVKLTGDVVKNLALENEQSQNSIDVQRRRLSRFVQKNGTPGATGIQTRMPEYEQLTKDSAMLQSLSDKIGRQFRSDSSLSVKTIQEQLKAFKDAADWSGFEFSKETNGLFDNLINNKDITNTTEFLRQFDTQITEIDGKALDLREEIEGIVSGFHNVPEEEMQTFQNWMNGFFDLLSEQGIITEEQAEAAARFRENIEQGSNAIKQAKVKQADWSQSLVATTSAISATAMALSTIKGLIDTWNNEDMSFGEKLFTSFTSIAMILPMVTSAFNMQNLAQMATVSSSIAAALGFSGEAQAAIAAGEATVGFGTALYTVLWPIGLVVAAIMALIGVVYLIVQAYKAWEASSPEGQLKTLEEETQKATEAFERMTTSINETKTSLDNLQGAYKTLEGLKEGTLEWQEAVADINAEILKILDTYPQLAAFVQSNNGLLSISDIGISKIKELMASEYSSAYNNKVSAQIRESKQKIEVGKTKYQDPIGMIIGTNYNDFFDSLQKLYDDPRLGEQLFTGYGARLATTGLNKEAIKSDLVFNSKDMGKSLTEDAKNAFIEGLSDIDWNNTDDLQKLAQVTLGNAANQLDYSSLSEDLLLQQEAMQETINVNEENIHLQNQMANTVQQLSKAQFENVLQQLGSTRTTEQGKNLLGKDYEDYKAEVRSTVTDKVNKGGFIGWQDRKNYTGNEDWIQQFMELQGAEKYVAQRKGKMVLEIQGEEKSFSRDEVINGLIDTYATEKMSSELTTKLKESVSNAFGQSAEKIPLDKLIDLDNFQNSIQNSLSESLSGDELTSKVQSITQAVGEAYGDLSKFQESISYIDFDDSTVQQKLIALSEQLKNDIIDIEEYKKKINEINELGKLDTFSSMFSGVAEEIGGTKAEVAELSADMQNYAKYLMQVSRESNDLSDNLASDAEGAARLAIQITKMNKGIDALADGIEEWDSILRKSSKSSAEYSKALSSVREALSNVLDVNFNLISDDFIANNLDDIKAAATGSAEAIDRLTSKMDEEIILKITADQSKDFVDKVYEANQELQAIADGLDPTIEVGTVVDDTNFIEAANKLVQDAQMTADEANAYFAGIGYEPVYNTQEIDNSAETPNAMTTVQLEGGSTGSLGFDLDKGGLYWKEKPNIKFSTRSEALPSTSGDETMRLTSFSGGTTPPPIKGMRKKATGKSSNYSSSNSGGKSPGSSSGSKGGGGGSSKKPTEPTKVKPTEQKQKKDEVDRYHEIKEVLDDIQSDLDEISNLKDEAFGADKLKAMDNEKKKLLEIVDAQKKYQAEVAKNLNDDKWEASQVGAQFDEEGRITNVQALQEQWRNEWNAQAAAFDAREQDLENQLAAAKNAENEDLQSQIEKQKDALSEEREKYDKAYENKKDAISQYEETLNLSEEARKQLEDYLRQIRQLNYERLEYKLQIRVELNESDLADIEHLLSRLSENDFSKSAERIALISKEAKNYRLMADDQKRFIEKLKAQYAAGEINQEQFIKGMKKAKDAVLEAETSIREGIVTIGDELRNAFSNAADDLDKTYERMQRRLDFGDFYKEISQVINGEPDYDILNSIIDSQSTLTQARVDGRLREREVLIARQQELYTQMNQTTSEETKAQIRETLDQVESRIADTNSEIQSDIQALADYAQEKFTNAIEKISKEWQEKNFGDSLDNILDEIDLRNRAQEELLTTTNKVYETNKLIRQAEKDIDATTNKRAKQAYQEYIAKAKQKQEQNELTQLELDLLAAEYEITKAQIALEEAQNAKDTVRLTRNSEGNFGYVYTANQDKIADAQQSLEDATNNYYNIALEGAKSASQQIYALEQEWQKKVKEIYADTTLSAEEKSEKVQEITDYYYTMIEQQRDKYYIATDAMRESSYEHEVDYDMKSIKSAENWFNNHDELITELKRAQRTYQTEIEDVSKNVEKAYGNQKDAVEYIDKATKVYSDDLDILIPKMETDLTKAVDTATLAWSNYADKLREVIELSNQIMGETQETLMKETYKDNYQARIDELLDAGYSEDSKEVQMLKRFRKEKISATDWYGMAQDAIRNGKSFDEVSWIAKIRDEKSGGNDSYDLIKGYYDKFSQDYFGDLQNLVTNGYTFNSEEVKGLIALRDWKLGELGQKATTLEDLKKWMTEKGISFASGGYTGEWGPDGKLAILHEKELVLNSDDTKNILTSVGIIREISKALDNSAVWAMFGQASLNAATVGASADSTLQQEVTIHADFPNVTDHNEIELAIDNLINAASQYAYRT